MSRCQHQYILLLTCIYSTNANRQTTFAVQCNLMQVNATNCYNPSTFADLLANKRYRGRHAETGYKFCIFEVPAPPVQPCSVPATPVQPCSVPGSPCPVLPWPKVATALTPHPDLLTEGDERRAPGTTPQFQRQSLAG